MADLPALSNAALALDGRVATLTFQRDDMRNALTGTEIAVDIVATLNWANTCADVSVLIMTGEGSAFSAGGNIKTMSARAKESPHVLAQYYKYGVQKIPLAMQAVEIPVIAAINGPAIGAGFDLANMCDIRIGSTNAQFGETFANLGLIAGDGGGWFLQRMVGYQRAAELTFSGRIVKAEEALSLGILLEVTEPDALVARAQAMAAKMATKPPLALRYSKRLLRLAQQQGLQEHLDTCSSYQAICQKSDDHQEALAAFFEKRSGIFRGR